MQRLFDLNPTDTKRLTDKQVQILSLIIDGCVVDGEKRPIDMDFLLERLPYRTTKESMQFSIRPLVRRQIIRKVYESRRGQKRVCYEVTDYGIMLMDNLYEQKAWEKKLGESYLDVFD